MFSLTLQFISIFNCLLLDASKLNVFSTKAAYYTERPEGVEGESAQRCKARLERHQRTTERAVRFSSFCMTCEFLFNVEQR